MFEGCGVKGIALAVAFAELDGRGFQEQYCLAKYRGDPQPAAPPPAPPT